MPRLNDIQNRYGSQGVQVVSVNYQDTDSEIAAFITTWGATYALARVADDSGYTVPMFSWMFAIDSEGRLLWSGLNDNLTDAMIEAWIAGPQDDDKDKNACMAQTNGHAPVGVIPLAAVAMLLLGIRATRRRDRTRVFKKVAKSVASRMPPAPGLDSANAER